MRHSLIETPAPIPIAARLVYPEIPIPTCMALALPVSSLLSRDMDVTESSSQTGPRISMPSSNCFSPPPVKFPGEGSFLRVD